jgi:hypothetical protein
MWNVRRLGRKAFTIGAVALWAAEMPSERASPGDSLNLLLDVAVFVGLVGYSWGLIIGPRGIWKVLFCVEALYLEAVAVLVLPVLWQSPNEFPEFFASALLLGAGMRSVRLYGLYRYGFSHSPPWYPSNLRLQSGARENQESSGSR